MKKKVINSVKIKILLFMIINTKSKINLKILIKVNFKIIVLQKLIQENQEIYIFN